MTTDIATAASVAVPQTEDINYKEWPEFRDFIRKIQCVCCQHTGGKDSKGELLINEGGYVQELVRVSDPHHHQTRGAGGPDTENLVSICGSHHSELGKVGRDTFQLMYDLDLKVVARFLFKEFLESLEGEDYPGHAQARHHLILGRMYDLQQSAILIGKELNEFKSQRTGGKNHFEWLGFTSIEAYIEAPVDSGGLGMSARKIWRYMKYAELTAQYGDECGSIREIGPTKAEVIAPLLKRAQTTEERAELVDKAKRMSTADLVSMRNQVLKRPDRRQKIHGRLLDHLAAWINSVGVEVPQGALDGLAWDMIRIVEARNG